MMLSDEKLASVISMLAVRDTVDYIQWVEMRVVKCAGGIGDHVQ